MFSRVLEQILVAVVDLIKTSHCYIQDILFECHVIMVYSESELICNMKYIVCLVHVYLENQ